MSNRRRTHGLAHVKHFNGAYRHPNLEYFERLTTLYEQPLTTRYEQPQTTRYEQPQTSKYHKTPVT